MFPDCILIFYVYIHRFFDAFSFEKKDFYYGEQQLMQKLLFFKVLRISNLRAQPQMGHLYETHITKAQRILWIMEKEECNRHRMGKRDMKFLFLDIYMTSLLHTRTHSICDYIHMTCTTSSYLKILSWKCKGFLKLNLQ